MSIPERRIDPEPTMCQHGNDEDWCEVCHPELESDEDAEVRLAKKYGPQDHWEAMGYDILAEKEMDHEP